MFIIQEGGEYTVAENRTHIVREDIVANLDNALSIFIIRTPKGHLAEEQCWLRVNSTNCYAVFGGFVDYADAKRELAAIMAAVARGETIYRISQPCSQDAPQGQNEANEAAQAPAAPHSASVSASKAVLDTPIECLDLSSRTLSCLMRTRWANHPETTANGAVKPIRTVRDLTESSRRNICKLRNFGKKSLMELDLKMHELGVWYKEL